MQSSPTTWHLQELTQLQEQSAVSLAPAAGGVTRSLFEQACKRTLDVVLALFLLVLSLPALLICMVLILLVDRQWPLYLDRRAGRDGSPFTCFKLRSMRSDREKFEQYLAANPEEAERYRVSSKVLNDPRKTRLGSLLRKLSLDEVPQFVNVLLGQMSIVGPRPMIQSEFYNRYPASLEVVRVKPGLTGLWQVTGRSNLPEGCRDAIDIEYACTWSLAMDVGILLRTPIVILSGRGAR